MSEVRINKLLSERGICSRREADRFIEEGRIRADGKTVTPGLKVSDKAKIEIDGKAVDGSRKADKPEPVVIAFYKPRGIVCTSSDKDKAENIIDFIGYKTRLFTIGRLDKDSEGLILLTNRGELVNLINKSSNAHEKEYVVRCTHRLTEGFLKRLEKGVEIKLPSGKDSERKYRLVKTKPCTIRQIDDHTFNIILTQGLNRQIRRMVAAMGNNVERLKRVRVMNIELEGLKEGKYREVCGKELKELEKLIGLKH